MSFQKDPVHKWRAMTLSGIPVQNVRFDLPKRTKSVLTPDLEQEASSAQLGTWLDSCGTWGLDQHVGESAISQGEVTFTFEVGDARTGTEVSVDDGEVRTTALPYDYIRKDTVLEFSSADTHMQVKPLLNTTAVQALHTAPSIDEFAKAAGLKLARTTTSAGGNSSIPDVMGYNPPARVPRPGDMLINQMEELRGLASEHLQACDYGWRLWSMANVCAHSLTLRMAGQSAAPAAAMSQLPPMQMLLVGKTPYLAEAHIRGHSWWYVADERAATYRALMIMAGRGLAHYVAPGQDTVYSRMRIEPEVEAGTTMVFVTRSGVERERAPTPAHFCKLLSDPALCISAYYAYAASVGVGFPATTVLLQSLHMPHLYGARGVLPYYPEEVKLDAMTYLLGAVDTSVAINVTHATRAHANAAVLSTHILAGLGAALTTFKAGMHVDVITHIDSLATSLSSGPTTRGMLQQLHGHLYKGCANLHWIDPFRVDVGETCDRAVAAWRRHPMIFANYLAVPVLELAPLYTTGVDMRATIIGAQANITGTYLEQTGLLITCGREIICKCERLATRHLPPQNDRVWAVVRRWRLVVRGLWYSCKPISNVVLRAITGAHTTLPPPEPYAPQAPTPMVQQPAPPTTTDQGSTISHHKLQATISGDQSSTTTTLKPTTQRPRGSTSSQSKHTPPVNAKPQAEAGKTNTSPRGPVTPQPTGTPQATQGPTPTESANLAKKSDGSSSSSSRAQGVATGPGLVA